MNLFKKIIFSMGHEQKSIPNEIPQVIADEDFDDEEYERVANAKENLLSRIDKEKMYEICNVVEMKSYLMDDHKHQYRNL